MPGRYRISVLGQIIMLKYVKRLETLPNERIAKKTFEQLIFGIIEGQCNCVSPAIRVVRNKKFKNFDY